MDMDEFPQIGVESITRVVGVRHLAISRTIFEESQMPRAPTPRVRQAENPQKASGVYTPHRTVAPSSSAVAAVGGLARAPVGPERRVYAGAGAWPVKGAARPLGEDRIVWLGS
jgi:hypothetical protein